MKTDGHTESRLVLLSTTTTTNNHYNRRVDLKNSRSKNEYRSLWEISHEATEHHLPYRMTQHR